MYLTLALLHFQPESCSPNSCLGSRRFDSWSGSQLCWRFCSSPMPLVNARKVP